MFKFLRSLFNGTAPFIQRNRRLELANHLAMNVSDAEYDHSMIDNRRNDGTFIGDENHFCGCTFGHACEAKLHGFGFVNVDGLGYNGKPVNNVRETIAAVYGEHFTDRIVSAGNRFTRQQAVEALRNY